MKRKTSLSVVLAGLAFAGAASVPASAMTVQQPPLVIDGSASASNPLMVEVKAKKGHHKRIHRVWNRKAHGPRCLRRYGACRHYHNGFYYTSPWWLISAPVVVIGGGTHGSRHVAWCEDHYKSYNRHNNTWVSYSGEVRQCNSPYDNR